MHCSFEMIVLQRSKLYCVSFLIVSECSSFGNSINSLARLPTQVSAVHGGPDGRVYIVYQWPWQAPVMK